MHECGVYLNDNKNVMIFAAIWIFFIAFLLWMWVGRDSEANFFCRHEWEEAVKKEDKHWTYIWYVCKKCKWARKAYFTFDE